MRVSIVIPAYNGEKYLPFTVASVQAQTVTDWELVIVDDGSTDRTQEIAGSYAAADGRIRVVHQENGGLSAARNAGFKASDPTTPYIIFLDADDLWEPDTLAILLDALETHPDSVGVHGLARFIDAEGNLFQPGDLEAHTRHRKAIVGKNLVSWPVEKPTTFAVEVVTNFIPTAGTVLLRREPLAACGPFDTDLRSCEDWDMWLRLLRYGDMLFVDKVVLGYRQHGGNMSKKHRTMEETERKVWRKLLTWPNEDASRRQAARQGYRHHWRQIIAARMGWAKGCLRKGQFAQAARHLRHAARGYAQYVRRPEA